MTATTFTANSTTATIPLEQIRQAIIALIARHPADSQRIARGARLLVTHPPTEVDAVRGVYTVDSEDTAGVYYIVMQGPTPRADGCTCPDFQHRGQLCKHVWLVRVYQACAGCAEPTARRAGTVPLCTPCLERDAHPPLPTCRGCGEKVAALSYGVCGMCAARQCFQD